MEDCTYKVSVMMKETALSRRMKAFAILNSFEYGSLWFVGENIWKAKLLESYVQREDRVNHPAICVQNGSAVGGVHAVVPMWYGTTLHMNREKDVQLVRAGKRYVLKNFTGSMDDAEHKTMFGHFSPVPIERDYLGRDIVAKGDFEEGRKQLGKPTKERVDRERKERYKNMIRRNKNRCLDAYEMDELRRFMRRYLSCV